MTIERGALAWAVVAIISAVASALYGSMDAAGPSLAFAAVAAVALLFLGIRVAGGFNNLLCVFLLFHLLYGLSGPINALYGAPLPDLFSLPYETGSFLANFSYASAALASALVLSAAFSDITAVRQAPIAVDPRTLGSLALVFAGAASAMELTNLARVGIGAALQGKTVYQSAVDALVLTAPSYEFAGIAFSLFGLTVAGLGLMKNVDPQLKGARYGKAFFVLLSPLLLISLFLGRRGPILSWIIIFFIAKTWYESRRRIGRKVAAGMLTAYVLLGMLFANRAVLAYSFFVGDFSLLTEHLKEPEVIVSGLNPGGNEFGSAFGNFSEYVKYDVDGMQFGRSYVEGLALVVPSFLYPGTKPEPVAYAFRDRFFPGVEAEGAIASTAYSSILEAYVNFRQVGVAAVYFLVGLTLMAFERRRRRSRSLVAALVYLAIAQSTIFFHRADFGAAVIGPVFFALILIALVAALLAALQSFAGSRLVFSAVDTGFGDA